MDLLLVIYFAYRNSVRAKAVAQSGALWAFFTVLAYFATSTIGFLIVIFGICKDQVDGAKFLIDEKYTAAVVSQWKVQVVDNTLNSITILLFGIGGYLFVRYLLERKIVKPEQKKVDWMDKYSRKEEQ